MFLVSIHVAIVTVNIGLRRIRLILLDDLVCYVVCFSTTFLSVRRRLIDVVNLTFGQCKGSRVDLQLVMDFVPTHMFIYPNVYLPLCERCGKG